MGEGRTIPRVVVTADDAGLCDEWDRAIFAAHAGGVVTAISVVTNGPVYERTRALLGGAPDLDMGVHLNVITGRPLSPPSAVRTLVGAGGCFCGSIGRFVVRYLMGAVERGEVEREWKRQVERALDNGLRPTHLNSHYHVHLLPGLFAMTVNLARRYGIRWVRVADEAPWRATGGVSRPTRLLKASGLWLVSQGCRDVLARAGLGRGVSCRGTTASGRLGPGEWRELLRRLGPGPTEIVCHPGQSSQEVAALTSAALPHELRRRAEPVGFRDLAVDA